jgi:hypothetical protein
MWIVGAVLLVIMIVEAAFILSTGLEKTATVADEAAVESVQ